MREIYPESTRHKAVHNTSDAAGESIRRVVYGGTGSGCVRVMSTNNTYQMWMHVPPAGRRSGGGRYKACAQTRARARNR
jgi:hypothetical protein